MRERKKRRLQSRRGEKSDSDGRKGVRETNRQTERDWSHEDQEDLDTPETPETHIPALIHCLTTDNTQTVTCASTQITRFPKNSKNQFNLQGETKNKSEGIKKCLQFVVKALYVHFDCMDLRLQTSRTAWQRVSQDKLGQLPVWVLIKGPFLDQKVWGIIWRHKHTESEMV